jgi:hypothetical protein
MIGGVVVEDAAELGCALIQGRGAGGIKTPDGSLVGDHHPGAGEIIKGPARIHSTTGSGK